MRDRVVLDVEIQKTIEETPGGWGSSDLLGVAVAVLYEYETDRFRIYGPEDVERLRHRLLQAEEIIGFNIVKFDLPVIWGISQEEWQGSVLRAELLPRCNDLLRRIWQALGHDPDVFDARTHCGWSLGVVANGTLGVGKIGYGGDAPKWYQAGQWARVVNYCVDDVALERDLSDFVDRYGYVVNGKTDQIVSL